MQIPVFLLSRRCDPPRRRVPSWTMSTSNGRRVAVTGMGFVTPIGHDVETVWSNLVEGVSGVGPITRFDTEQHACKIAAEVRNFEAADYMDRKTARNIGRFCQFALAASKMAVEESGLVPAEMDPDDVGVIVSTAIGGMEEIERNQTILLERGVRRVSPFTVPMMIPDMGSGLVAMHLRAGGPRAMRKALERASLEPTEIGYINAHGTSTKVGDIAETKAIKQVFGDHAYKLAVSSTKSVHAHLLGGAGAMEAAATILALGRGMLPPTINLENQDPECDLDYIPNRARKAEVQYALSNSFGFGGHNATLVIKRPDPN